MAHWSESSKRLEICTTVIADIAQLEVQATNSIPSVILLYLPPQRSDTDAANSQDAFEKIASFCKKLHEETTVCVLTSASDAARLLPFLEKILAFQLWVAVKTPIENNTQLMSSLPGRHCALLVLTRYNGSLRHTKTRIQYTYCPACGKSTKDYGGKKHVYHEYGTLMADVWRDIEYSPGNGISPLTERLQDLFGLEPYINLQVLDMSVCSEMLPERNTSVVRETYLPLEWVEDIIPLGSKLINADCLTALKEIPGNSVDFCFADPPYNLQKRYDHWDDALETRAYFEWCDQWLTEMARVLKPGRTLVVLNIPLWAVRHYKHLATLLQFQQWIVWEALGFPVRMIMPAHYSILCFSKGVPRPLPGQTRDRHSLAESEASTAQEELYCFRGNCLAQRRRLAKNDRSKISDLWHDIHRLKHNSRRVDHPCQLPPILMRRLYAIFSETDEMVLDCFNGSGTSTLVAQQMGRRFTGIELSQEYHILAEKRHQQLSRGEDPFAKNEVIPKAKNSLVARLPKQQYEVTKKNLQLDVRRIARKLGKMPSRDEVQANTPFPMEYFDKYFISWGEVCAAARTTGMSELPTLVSPLQAEAQLTFEEC